MLANNIKTSVCIVGAGPVGMSMVMLLKKFGIDSVLLERGANISPHPKAHVILPRTIEIMKELGLEQEIIDRTPPIEYWTSYRYCRYVLDSEPYGIANHFEDGIQNELNRVREYSMSMPVHFSQNRFCEVLRNRLLKEDMQFTDVISRKKYSPLLFNHNFIDYDFNMDEYRIKVQAVDMVKNELRNIHCKYLVGCEGVGSKIRESLGGEFVGKQGIADFINIHFKSKQLSEAIKKKNVHAMLYFIYNTKIATILVNHNVDLGEFVLQTPYFPPVQDLRDFSYEDCEKMVLDAINSDKFHDSSFLRNDDEREVTKIDEIANVGHWTMSACASDVFGDSRKNVYIAGDSGHSIPPAGGYGMNSGICDAHNLAHKIADAEFNYNPKVLKDYDSERKFIGSLTAKYALQNFIKGEKIVNKLNVDLLSFK